MRLSGELLHVVMTWLMIHLWQTQNIRIFHLCVLTTTPTEGVGRKDLGFLKSSQQGNYFC